MRGRPRRPMATAARPPSAAAIARQSASAHICKLRATLPFCSQSALGALLEHASKEELPSGNRNRVREARDDSVFLQTEYGKIHQIIHVPTNNGHMDLEVQSPQAMLSYMCSANKSFVNRVEDAFVKRQPSVADPWTIIIYTDEILPGNALAHTTNRKCWGWYWSILELGPATLCNEDAHRARQSLSCSSVKTFCCR